MISLKNILYEKSDSLVGIYKKDVPNGLASAVLTLRLSDYGDTGDTGNHAGHDSRHLEEKQDDTAGHSTGGGVGDTMNVAAF